MVILPALALLQENWNHAAPAAHHVAVAGATETRILGARVGIGLHKNFFRAQLGCAIKVDRIHSLVCTQSENAAHALIDGRIDHILPPMMLVWIASNGLYSQAGTCLSAAACTTTVTPEKARSAAAHPAHPQ